MRQRTQNRFLAMVLIFGAMLIGSWPQAVLAQLSCSTTQITHTPDGNLAYGVSANNDVTRIAFTSNENITGGNPNNIPQIFLYNTTTSTFTQITSRTEVGGREIEGAISGDGTKIAMVTDSDLTGGNPDGSSEVFLFDIATNTYTQLTNGAFLADLVTHSISINGARVPFHDNADLTGDNPDGSSEVFLSDANVLRQITDGNFSTGPAISLDGSRMAFYSDSNPTGGNANGNQEVFLFNISTNTFTQITDDAVQASGGPPSLNNNGTRIAFTSNADLVGDNGDFNSEVFLFRTDTNELIQLTHTTFSQASSNQAPVIAAGAERIAFSSNLDGGGVFLFDTASSSLTKVHNVENFGPPAISVDGDRLAFRASAVAGSLEDSNVFLATCTQAQTADLRITKGDRPDPVLKGKDLLYEISVFNGGPSAASSLVLNDTIPSSTRFQSLDVPAGWSCTTPAVGSTGTVQCMTPTKNFGSAAAVFLLVVNVPATVANGTILSNTATISSNTADSNMANNTTTQLTSVNTPNQAFRLTLLIQGQGAVTSNPAGINCRPTCMATYGSGTQVVLTATPAARNQFVGWSGEQCGGTGTCTVSMLGDRTIQAVFRRQ